MAPRSPTQAFDPTPALEHNQHNYSPLNHTKAMIAVDNHFPHASKGVRFSTPPVSTLPRAHSIATDNVPLLPSVTSASTLPRQAFRIVPPSPGIDINAYIENCRNLNEQLRIIHESERKSHESERRTWDIERSALKAKITELEYELNRGRGGRRRASHEPGAPNIPEIKLSFRNKSSHAEPSSFSVPQKAAPPESLTSPVWKGPEQHPPTARVFPSDELSGTALAGTSENESFPHLSREISPTNIPPIENVPIPIQEVEPTLDGITLKSSGPAINSSFVTKITSPQFGSPALSPAPVKAQSEPPNMTIDTSSLLAPLDEKLKRHAGHTPMNFDGAAPSQDVSSQVTELPTPIAEKPPAPAPTARPPLRPSENSDSYFSTTDIGEKQRLRDIVIPEEEEDAEPDAQFTPQDDKPLNGPLMLDHSARTKAADAFLSSVDAKLMAAVKEVSPTRRESILSESAEPVQVPATAMQSVLAEEQKAKQAEVDDDMPKLKLKKSMNFGSAYGSGMPGKW